MWYHFYAAKYTYFGKGLPMPRSTKSRKVCGEFKHKVFSPEDGNEEYVVLAVDEMEALRLCDYENLEQAKAARQMGISRGTFQRLLYSGRHKSVEALCEGKGILIQGGNYEISGKDISCDCGCKRCKKQMPEFTK
jgi:uncharacterized protein